MENSSSQTNHQPSVSIALAVYNGAKFLKPLLSSLQNQTTKPCELVVLDDCSSDNSVEIINDYPLSFNKKIFLNEENMGPVPTFKKLAGLCSGEFIAFCDQDDIWLSDKLELSLSEIKKTDAKLPALVFTDLSVIDEQGNLLYDSFWKLRKIHPEKIFFADILFGNIVTGCTVIINRSMVDEFAKMPNNIIMYDWWLAMIAYSFGAYSVINKPTVLYRSHNNSVTTKDETSYFKIFLKEYKNRSNYLNDNINQALEFQKIYLPKLNKKQTAILKKFIHLQQKSFLQKRLTRDWRSLLKRLK